MNNLEKNKIHRLLLLLLCGDDDDSYVEAIKLGVDLIGKNRMNDILYRLPGNETVDNILDQWDYID